ncbi:MAG: hypothetical protein AB7T31_04960 [Gemmatimonadales bacterium]
MVAKAFVVWVVGLVTLVPYGVYYLFAEASRDQYALLITLVLFWIFGYWSLVTPVIMALRMRAVLRTIELARSREDLQRALSSPAARDVAVDLIASENRIPRFLAARLVARVAKRVMDDRDAPAPEGAQPRRE